MWVKGQSGNPNGRRKIEDCADIPRNLNAIELGTFDGTKEERDSSIHLAWEIGRLEYKLSPLQREIRAGWELSKLRSRQYLMHIGRQTGKTYMLNLIAIQYCIRNPGCTVVVIAPVEKKLAAFIRGILNTLLKDCPKDLMPQRLEAKNQLVFKNGSVIHYFGATHDNHNAIRGLGSVSFLVLDEAGFFTNLPELVAVVSPMLLRTNGFLVFSSSSPESPDHPFVAFIEQAKMENWYVFHPTWDDKTLPQEALDGLAKLLGGKNSSKYRREVGCELIVEKTKQVLPEWDSSKYVQDIPKLPVYRFMHHFVSYDPGFRDPSSVTFGTYLFGEGKLYIEDEIVIPGRDITIDKFAALIKQKVTELWPNSDRISYWADPSNQTILDELGKRYGLYFNWTAKDKKEQALEALRAFIGEGRLILAPRCKIHKTMFENTIWKDDHKEFERSASGFHGDCVDSTLYLFRNLRYDNPIPSWNGINYENNFVRSPEKTDENKKIGEWISAGLDDAMQQDDTGKDQGEYD